LGSVKTDRVDLKYGDVLFLADAFWAPPYLSLTTAGEAKKNGARVLLLINDVFPLSRPEYVETSTIKSFARMLPEALSLADFLVFPSLQTQNELNSFYPITAPRRIIQYGSEKSKTLSLDESQERVPGSILMVGTIEPRKNHRVVLDWFLSLASPDTKLTVIGQSGWMNSSEVSTLVRESKRDLGLTWINSASDEDLAYEMHRHEIGIMASHAEGLGLPILEYSSHGLKLVLSDIPIFRDVAGDVAFFFDGGSVESLDEAIRKAREEKRVLSLPHVSWDNTASDIVAFLREYD
jgi:alpha-1,2-rhamnosyltransferase